MRKKRRFSLVLYFGGTKERTFYNKNFSEINNHHSATFAPTKEIH